MSRYRIGVLDGDGIGPEIVEAALQVLRAATADGPEFDFVPLLVGHESIRQYGEPLTDDTIRTLEGCHGWICGPHDSESYPEQFRSVLNPSGRMRHHFDLYANLRPARTLPNVRSLAGEADMLIVRENTEGFYADRNMFLGRGEFMPTPDVALAVGLFTRRGANRIARTAFELARGRRKKVTIVHKYNVLRMTYGLFLEECRRVAADYPDVQVDDYHIDAMAALLLRRPAGFDVILTTNMFGDILSDLAAELVGSLGLAAGMNAGDRWAMAQAAHGSAPDIAGRGIANPCGMILSVAQLMHWLGAKHNDPTATRAGDAIEAGVVAALADSIRTGDLGGSATTREFAAAVAERVGVRAS